jgi:LPS-assembly protein
MSKTARLALAVGLGLACIGAGPAARSQAPGGAATGPRLDLPASVESKRPVVINAKELVHDRERATVTARGNVMIFQGDRVVLADEVTYDQNANRVVATGNVAILEPGGNTIFAARAELTRDMKEGVLDQFRMLFPDDSKIAANSAVRSEGTRLEMSRVVFSPCRLCAEDPTRPPFWQIKARKVVHDQTTRDITYSDAVMEIFGVPVFYAPWFQHPDPTVNRRSGVLQPIFGHDSRLGFVARLPYFLVLDRDKDATLTPFVTTNTGGAYGGLHGQYRQRFVGGGVNTEGSLTYVRRTDINDNKLEGHRFRGHIFGKGQYDINRSWRTGFDAGVTSDRTYLKRYGYFAGDTLASTAWTEGFFQRDYASLRLFHFRTLRTEEEQGTLPVVLPLAGYQMIGQPIGGWGRWQFDASLLGVYRSEGGESRRLSLSGGWHLPYVHPWGWVATADLSLNSDLYWVTGNEQPGGDTFSGATGRIFPQVKLDLRYPFVRELGNVRHVIEPRFAMVVTPPRLNNRRIPNEDSVDFELDDTNLFGENRFPGRDRIDDGLRFVYGLGNVFHGNRGGRAEFFFGQSWRLFGESEFLANSGLREHLSDFVGRVRISPSPYLDVLWRFRMDARELSTRRHEVTLRVGSAPFSMTAGYLDFSDQTGSGEFPNRRQFRFGMASQITENWAVRAATVINLVEARSQLQSVSVTGEYRNECCTITGQFNRSFDIINDNRPTTRFIVLVDFKYLGAIRAAF